MSDFLSKLNRFFPVEVDNLKEKYKGSNKEQVMNTIFNVLDVLDSTTGFLVKPEELKEKQDGKINATADFNEHLRNNILDNGEISQEKVQKLFGEGVTTDDIEQALNDLLEESQLAKEKTVSKIAENREQMISSIDDENLPEDLKQMLMPQSVVDIIEVDGKKIYSIDFDGTGEVRVDYNEMGIRTQESCLFDDDGKYGAGEEINLYNEDGSDSAFVRKYATGLIDGHDFATDKKTLKFGKTVFEYEDKRLLSQEEIDERWATGNYSVEDGWKTQFKNVTLNQGLPNQTKLEFEYDDNGNIRDVKLASEDQEQMIDIKDGNSIVFKMPTIKLSSEEKRNLISLLNKNARLGNDFELKINGNNVEVLPTILDADGDYVENIPQAIKKDVVELLKQGFRAGKDYNITQNEDGSFCLDYDTQNIMEYECDEKFITYSKDGKNKSTTLISGDEIKIITTDKNGATFTTIQSRSEQFLQSLLSNDLEGANKLLDDITHVRGKDFNLYDIALKYQEQTGKNLIDEAIEKYINGELDGKFLERLGGQAVIFSEAFTDFDLSALKNSYDTIIEYKQELRNFDINKTTISKDLPQIDRKKQLGDFKYSQKINNADYIVELKNNKIEISKNGILEELDLAGVHPNIQKNIAKASPNVLYDLALKGIPLIIKDQYNQLDTHTQGIYNAINKSIELYSEVVAGSNFNQVLAHEVGHTFHNQMNLKNDKLEKCFEEEYSAWLNAEEPIKSGNEVYCTENIFEFFAEAYTLIKTGNSDSAYTIAKHFPQTFAVVKEMLEKEDK